MKKLFSDVTLGKSEFEARIKAHKWETVGKYIIKNIVLVKKPSFWHKINPFISPYYVVSFDVYSI